MNLRAAMEDSAADKNAAQAISDRYRAQAASGASLVTKLEEAQAYAITRMPATYAATYTALSWALKCIKTPFSTLLDLGAGTGAGSWAARELYDFERMTCIERQPHMRALGEKWLPQAQWIAADLCNDAPLPPADLVIISYVLNEMPEDMRTAVVKRAWSAAQVMLLIIEPGTPKCYNELMAIRASYSDYIAAPCPHSSLPCPLIEPDWCHFYCRVSRSRLHKQLKGADVPFEDEKFAYLALTKSSIACPSRIIRPPQLSKGRVDFTLCTPSGITKAGVLKRDPAYKLASKMRWGDAY